MNLLAICVGNTRTRIGTFVDNMLKHTNVLSNANFAVLNRQLERAYQPIRAKEGAVVLLASTSPPIGRQVIDAIKQHLHTAVVQVEQDLPVPIGRQLDPEAIVGDDRLLNAAAAYDVLQQACVVVDAGTAITVDFVDGAGTFHGGAIAPGAQMMLKSLAQQTSQLPDVDLSEPMETIGHNTVDAIRCGVFYGLRGMVRELTERYAELAGVYPMIIATGGDAELLFSGYELVDRVVPDLTLLGMKLTLAGPAGKTKQ